MASMSEFIAHLESSQASVSIEEVVREIQRIDAHWDLQRAGVEKPWSAAALRTLETEVAWFKSKAEQHDKRRPIDPPYNVTCMHALFNLFMQGIDDSAYPFIFCGQSSVFTVHVTIISSNAHPEIKQRVYAKVLFTYETALRQFVYAIREARAYVLPMDSMQRLQTNAVTSWCFDKLTSSYDDMDVPANYSNGARETARTIAPNFEAVMGTFDGQGRSAPTEGPFTGYTFDYTGPSGANMEHHLTVTHSTHTANAYRRKRFKAPARNVQGLPIEAANAHWQIVYVRDRHGPLNENTGWL